MKPIHLAAGMLALTVLTGCMATDPSLAPTASLSPNPAGFGSADISDSGSADFSASALRASEDGSDSGEFAAMLPEIVTVLPAPSDQTQVGYAETVDLAAASFAGSEPSKPVAAGAFQPAPQPSAPAAKAPAVEPQPAALTAGPFPPAPERPAPPSGEQVFLEPMPAAFAPRTRPFRIPPVEGGSAEVNRLIEKYAELYQVPADFVRRVVKRESNFNPGAVNRGHWGLMQIKHATARGMGYRGPPRGLLDAETNLKYAVRYLRGAWMVAGGNPDLADRLYQSGYYYHAKRQGLLDETGLGRDRVRRRMAVDDVPVGAVGLL